MDDGSVRRKRWRWIVGSSGVRCVQSGVLRPRPEGGQKAECLSAASGQHSVGLYEPGARESGLRTRSRKDRGTNETLCARCRRSVARDQGSGSGVGWLS